MTPLALPAVASGAPTLDTIHCTDALTLLRALPDGCVNCIVTSPPYWGLRDYGVAGQIGMEPTLKEFIQTLVDVFHEARRVLRDDGTLWVNMGDCYASSPNGRSAQDVKLIGNDDRTFRDKPFSTVGNGLKPKDLVGQPWRLAFALQDDGWYLRSDIIWHKPNPMPESIADRPTKSHEYVFLLTKSPRYYYDDVAIREPAVDGDPTSPRGSKGVINNPLGSGRRKQDEVGDRRYTGFNERWDNRSEPLTTRNKRTVWTVSTEPNPSAHFATFPQALIEPMILAGCPDQVCSVCGAPHERLVTRDKPPENVFTATSKPEGISAIGNHKVGMGQKLQDWYNNHPLQTVGFRPTCEHTADTRAGIVLDPFMGSGTTALVARRLGRHYIGSELNPDYVAIARERLAQSDPFQPRRVSDTATQLALFETVK